MARLSELGVDFQHWCFACGQLNPGGLRLEFEVSRDRAEARFSFELPLLPPGHYSINVAIAEGSQEQHVQHEWINDALIFRVETSSIRHSLVGIQMRSVELRRI